MKNILLSLVLLFSSFIHSQSPEIRHNQNYNSSRFPLGYNSGHLYTTGSGVWTELQPGVPRVDYWRVYSVNPDTGLAVGDMGAIIKTTDGGQHWYTIENTFNVSIKALGSFSGNPIFAAGGHGLIIKSIDYGESWTVIPSGTTKNFWNIEFINEQTAWLVGDSTALFKTTDGGNNWMSINTPLVYHTYYDISFLDSLFGYIGANGGYVLRTTDGGSNWDVTYVYDIYGLFTIKAVTREKAVALGFAGKQINTTDGGNTWNLTTYLGDTITDMAFIDTLKGYAVGISWGFETTDGGISWEVRPDMENGICINFTNNGTGYMFGMDLVNQKTTDEGESWNRMIINDDFMDLSFINENNGWFIGGNKLYKTTDGGLTLREEEDFPGDRPSSVYFSDSLTGIVGAMNKIFKTTNAGLTWNEKTISGVSGNAQEYFKLFFINDHIGWALGFAGYIVKTTDSGENWQSQLQSAGLSCVHFSDTLNGWLARDDGTSFHYPFKSINGGEEWIEQVNLPLSNTKNVFFNNTLDGFITKNDKLYHTSDGGVNFILVPEVTAGIGNFSNKISEHIFITGGNRIYFSTNAGENWEEINEIENKGLETTKLININIGISAGDKGIIYKYKDTLFTPVELILFKGTNIKGNKILLEWSTGTEINNKGFEIQRRNNDQSWNKIDFIDGKGNSTEPQNYKFYDKVEKAAIYYYRLKQIDYDGSIEYSKIINIEIVKPNQFKLNQNYPNPFNPDTKIEFEIPETAHVKLTVYNLLGERVKVLVNGKLEPGYYNYIFNGAHFSSGTYIYTLETKNQIESRKMILLK